MSISDHLKRTIGDSFLRALVSRIFEGQRVTRDEGIYLLKEAETGILGLVAREVSALRSIPYIKRRACHVSLSSGFLRIKPGAGLSFRQLEHHLSSVSGVDTMVFTVEPSPEVTPDCLFRAISMTRGLFPDAWITGFDGPSLDLLSREHKISMEDLLGSLKESGLDQLLGGNAIPFDRVHRTAHTLGLSSQVSFTIGPGEGPEATITRLEEIRQLQDQTAGIEMFVPSTAPAPKTPCACPAKTSCMDDLRLFAASRIFLDNIRDIDAQTVIGATGWERVFSFGSNHITVFRKGSAPYIPYYGELFICPAGEK